jgi:hypothetical protein
VVQRHCSVNRCNDRCSTDGSGDNCNKDGSSATYCCLALVVVVNLKVLQTILRSDCSHLRDSSSASGIMDMS